MIKLFIVLSFTVVLIFLNSCKKNPTDNNNDIIQRDTLLLSRYEGYYKVYTKDGLIDSNSLTQGFIDSLKDVDFYMDSFILWNDSFSLFINDPFTPDPINAPDSEVNRIAYFIGTYSIKKDSICFCWDSAFIGSEYKDFDPYTGFPSDFCIAGSENSLYFDNCKYGTESSSSGSFYTKPGCCDYANLDSLINNLDDNTNLIYWYYKIIHE